ncbi:MAG: hypothetical protein M3290_08540 [Actinomycetota bacterium]|nr:hypothetical protein [Actinomycetota bacterium]
MARIVTELRARPRRLPCNAALVLLAASCSLASLPPPTSANGFARFVLNKWPDHGWTLGRGDSESGEVEDDFRKGSAIGVFKDNTRCKKKSRLYLIFNPNAG